MKCCILTNLSEIKNVNDNNKKKIFNEILISDRNYRINETYIHV